MTALLNAHAPVPAHAWSSSRLSGPTPAAPDVAWVRSLSTHQWIMWQAIEYLRRQGYPLADLFAQNFDSLALGNHYADHHCDPESGVPAPGDWTTDVRLGKPIEQIVEILGYDVATVKNCADVVEHFPVRPEVGHVEEIWDDVNGDDIFAPASGTQEYATKLYPVARAFLPGNVQPGKTWQQSQPQLGSLQPITLGSYRPSINLGWFDPSEEPMGSVRVGAVPRESPVVWPWYVAGPGVNGNVVSTAPQELRSAMFYLGWVAHLVGDSAQYYHRQRVSGPFHGGYEGDVDALIQTGAFDTAPKQFPIDRVRRMLLPSHLFACLPIYGYLACSIYIAPQEIAALTDEEAYAEAAQLGLVPPQSQCAVPLDYEATATSCTGSANFFAQTVWARWFGGSWPTPSQIVDAAAGGEARAACRCTEWSSESVWLDYKAAKDKVGQWGKSELPVFDGEQPSREMLASYTADGLSRGITTTAALFMAYGDEILQRSAASSAVLDTGFYQTANPDVAARSGGTSQGALVADWLTHGLGEGRTSSPAFDIRHYVAVTENALATGVDPVQVARQVGTLLASGHSPDGGTAPGFNAAQYLALNPDLGAMTDLQAMQSFAVPGSGIDARRIGSVLFDVRSYQARYSDAAASTPRAALAAWTTSGLAQGRAGSAAFDPAFYLKANGDVAAAAANDPVRGLHHYAANGVREGRLTSPAFDVRFYQASQRTALDQSGITAPGREPIHWLRTGIDAGVAGSAAFDPSYYRDSNPTLGLASNRAAVDQWLSQGLRDGRRSSIFYDPIYYVTRYPDLAGLVTSFRVYDPALKRFTYRNNYTQLTHHWLTNGIAEGRRGSAAFDAPYYRAWNPDVAAACAADASPNLCAMAHWEREGRAQGRLGAALPTTVGAADMGTANDVVFSYGGPIAGLSCVSVAESADPHGWSDNYLCSVRDLGLRWSSAGPIAGMACTQITEPADPYTWTDNYVCAPTSLGFVWSYAGPVAGKRCTQFLEPADPHTWTDNYLCH